MIIEIENTKQALRKLNGKTICKSSLITGGEGRNDFILYFTDGSHLKISGESWFNLTIQVSP